MRSNPRRAAERKSVCIVIREVGVETWHCPAAKHVMGHVGVRSCSTTTRTALPSRMHITADQTKNTKHFEIHFLKGESPIGTSGPTAAKQTHQNYSCPSGLLRAKPAGGMSDLVDRFARPCFILVQTGKKVRIWERPKPRPSWLPCFDHRRWQVARNCGFRIAGGSDPVNGPGWVPGWETRPAARPDRSVRRAS